MDVFDLQQVNVSRAEQGKLYLEFVRQPALSVGLYVLAAGLDDPQQPHTEDEVYHVIRGRGIIRVGDEDQAIGPGSVIYVAARVPHRFHSIQEELELLVFFAPAQHTNRPSS